MIKGHRQGIDQVKKKFFDRIMPEPNTGCWLWMGGINANGYGVVKSKHNFGFCNSSRLSYFIHNGDYDRAKLVCHHCDNPMCVNPDHLYLGTTQQNTDDKHRRNRADDRRGERNGRSKLSDEQIEYIRHRYEFKSKKNNAVEIAKDLGVSSTIIYYIVKKQNWGHL